MARVLCTIFSRQTLENRDWKTRSRSHAAADSTGRPGHVGDRPEPSVPRRKFVYYVWLSLKEGAELLNELTVRDTRPAQIPALPLHP